MSNQNRENVINIGLNDILAKEYDNLILSISVLGWELQIQTIIHATGLPIGDILASKETKIPSGSLAGRLGHEDLHSFITESKEGLGINFKWEDWANNTRAFLYKTLYSIYSADPKEIISQFNDIKQSLGHIPANSAEYHSAKDEFLINQKKEMIQNHELRMKELSDEIKIKNELYNASRGEVTEISLEILKLREEQDNLVSKHNLDIATKVSEVRMELSQDFSNKSDLMNKEWSAKLLNIQKAAEKEVDKVNEDLMALRSHYNSNNFIPVEDVKKISESLETEKSMVNKLLLKASHFDNEKMELQLIIKAHEEKIESLQEVVNSQSELINSLHVQLRSGYFKDKTIDSKDIEEMKAKILGLENYLNKFKEASFLWKSKYETGQIDLAKVNADLQEAKDSLLILEDIKRKSTNVKKINAGLMLLGAAAASALFIVFS